MFCILHKKLQASEVQNFIFFFFTIDRENDYMD